MLWVRTIFSIVFLLIDVHSVVVNTTLGPVNGTAASRGVCGSFYGIPYAAPPTGANRFRPPQPGIKWTAPRPALRANIGKSCLQTFGDAFINLPLSVEKFLENHPEASHMEPMSEDCLFLNVWTTANTTTNLDSLPVMVWFHGGSYMGGSGVLQSNYPFYDGQHLCVAAAAQDGVVIVTVNYRLGVFGFYSSEALLRETGTSGNMGTQDQP